MRHSALTEPIGAEAPCGPDLDEIGDDAFLNYTLSVDDRFPGRYYDIDSGAPFDRATVDLRTEVAIIAALLEKSRDLRLLSIEARFQILAGQIGGFSECVQAMADLVGAYWNDVHPQPYNGDLTLRQNTVSALAGRATVIFPLHNATIVRDRRHGIVTYRHQMILSGEAQPFPSAKALTANDIADALSNPDNAAAVAACHADIVAARQAVGRIEAAFDSEAGFEYAPDLDDLSDTLDRMSAFIETNVTALAPEKPASEDEAGFDADADVMAGPDSAPRSAVARTAPAVAIADHDDARAALAAAERYFARHENSSPALILVAQARQLIGKPLIEALQTLAADYAERAVIRIDAESGFQLDMRRMRQVTEGIEAGAPVVVAEPDVAKHSAATRAEAVQLMMGVEAFLKAAEPSSPVPILLEKARGFQNQDFRSILKTLIAR